MEGNVVAYLALLAWIPFAVLAFRRWPAPKACAIVLLGGAMLLPEAAALRIPGFAGLNKMTVPAVWAWIALALTRRAPWRIAPPLRGIEAVFWLVPIGGLGTALTNSEPLIYGPAVVPAHGLYEAFHFLQYDILTLLLPFHVSRVCFRSAEDARTFLGVLALAVILYLPLMLLELRLSPQLHNWVYGIPLISDFTQAMRGGGYRPNVFLRHGLALAGIVAAGTIAGSLFALRRWPLGPLTHSRRAFAVLGVAVLLARSAGALVFGAAGSMLTFFSTPRLTVTFAALLGVVTIFYPLLRFADFVPTQGILEVARDVFDEDRAASLQFRFETEDALATKTQARPWFGWGSFGRADVFDHVTGEDLSVRDGAWIIVLGERGLVGFAGVFGLLVGPLLLAYRRLARITDPDRRKVIATMATIVAVTALDLIPNGLFTFVPFVFAGVLAGTLEGEGRKFDSAQRTS